MLSFVSSRCFENNPFNGQMFQPLVQNQTFTKPFMNIYEHFSHLILGQYIVCWPILGCLSTDMHVRGYSVDKQLIFYGHLVDTLMQWQLFVLYPDTLSTYGQARQWRLFFPINDFSREMVNNTHVQPTLERYTPNCWSQCNSQADILTRFQPVVATGIPNIIPKTVHHSENFALICFSSILYSNVCDEGFESGGSLQQMTPVLPHGQFTPTEFAPMNSSG